MHFKQSFTTIFALLTCFYTNAQDTTYVQAKPFQSLLGPKTAGVPGKGIIGAQLILGASYDNLKPGISAVKGNDTTEVEIGPGGGTGLDIYAGKQLTKIFRFGLHSGFMLSSGTPEIKNVTIRFTRIIVMPVLNAGIKLNEESYINIGMGAYASFANSLYIKVPSDTIPAIKISYKPNLGLISHLQYENMVGENFSVIGGLRFHWVNLEVNEILVGSRKATLNAAGASVFNNINGGGVTLQFGANYFF